MRESMTAKICSFVRAFHSNLSKQKIFDDYLAYDMMGKEEYEEIGQLIQNELGINRSDPDTGFCGKDLSPLIDQYVAPIPLSRIAYAERKLESFAKLHGACQYVICGAGMDTFAFRNDNPDICIFELDHPDTQRYKLERIERLEWSIPENVRYVSIDFSQEDLEETLREAGFNPDIPSFFAILGVTYYLTLPVFEQTITKIADLSGEGNRIVFDYPDETTFYEDAAERVRLLAQITARLGEPMEQGLLYEDIKTVLERNSFSVEEHLAPERIQTVFFQDRKDGLRAFENIHLILAEKEGK
ncbi:class I SAM-dependent methyltransferase [Ruminiclostridium sufflavum]|nr:class I SAM-dependent methyltransferase [Ruminiclostridium sufflavum]